MGINAIVTPEDLAKTEATPVGWYPATVVKYEEAVTKGSEAKPSDGSMNAIFTIRLDDGPTKGKEFKRYFNEKNLQFGKNLWHVLFGFDKKKGGELSSDLFRTSEGKRLAVYVKRTDDGKYDEISDYRPLV